METSNTLVENDRQEEKSNNPSEKSNKAKERDKTKSTSTENKEVKQTNDMLERIREANKTLDYRKQETVKIMVRVPVGLYPEIEESCRLLNILSTVEDDPLYTLSRFFILAAMEATGTKQTPDKQYKRDKNKVQELVEAELLKAVRPKRGRPKKETSANVDEKPSN
jgi:hypothetical protein